MKNVVKSKNSIVIGANAHTQTEKEKIIIWIVRLLTEMNLRGNLKLKSNTQCQSENLEPKGPKWNQHQTLWNKSVI